MSEHTIVSVGYEMGPTFPNILDARAELKGILAEELKKARSVSETARKHKAGKDSYSITLGSDPKSALWSAHTIQKV
jgi:hypothetical protein